MEHIVVKIAGEPEILGRSIELTENSVKIEDPVYIGVKVSSSGRMQLSFQRATLLASPDKHQINVDMKNVLLYYYPSEYVSSYYESMIEEYREYYDVKFEALLRGHDKISSSQEAMKELIRNALEAEDEQDEIMNITANTTIH